jgi:hypothetical protein
VGNIVVMHNGIFLENVKVMAHPLAGANVGRGVGVEIACDHR